MTNLLLAAALGYEARGWSVIPLCSVDKEGRCRNHKDCQPRANGAGGPGKVPLCKWKEHEQQRSSAAQIKTWWRYWPEANVAVVTGQVSGIVMVDLDSPADEALLLELSGGEVTETLTFSTPRGRRLIYRLEPGQVIHRRMLDSADKKAHVLILGEGSYTVMPPSVHASGQVYGELQGELVPVPDWLWKLVNTPPGSPVAVQEENQGGAVATVRPRAHGELFDKQVKQSKRARAWLVKVAKNNPAIDGQGGSNQTYEVANRLLHGFHLPLDTAYDLFMELYNPYCQPPWSAKEARHKFDDALAKGSSPDMGEPHALNHSITRSGKGQGLATVVEGPKPESPSDGGIEICSWDEESRTVAYLLDPWIVRGEITMVYGKRDSNKSTFACWVAKQLSKNGVGVLFIGAEESWAVSLAPKLRGMGVDKKFVFVSRGKVKGGGLLSLDGDGLRRLRAFLRKHQIGCLIFDPVISYTPEECNVNNSQHVRRVLSRLQDLCDREGLAVLCLGHTNKSTEQDLDDRFASSSAWIDFPRLAFYMARDPENPGSALRYLVPVKNNLCRSEEKMVAVLRIGSVPALTIAGTVLRKPNDEEDTRATIASVDPNSGMSLEDFKRLEKEAREDDQGPGNGPRQERKVARMLIEAVLRSHGGKLPTRKVKEVCLAVGTKEGTYNRAAAELKQEGKTEQVQENKRHFLCLSAPVIESVRAEAIGETDSSGGSDHEE